MHFLKTQYQLLIQFSTINSRAYQKKYTTQVINQLHTLNEKTKQSLSINSQKAAKIIFNEYQNINIHNSYTKCETISSQKTTLKVVFIGTIPKFKTTLKVIFRNHSKISNDTKSHFFQPIESFKQSTLESSKIRNTIKTVQNTALALQHKLYSNAFTIPAKTSSWTTMKSCFRQESQKTLRFSRFHLKHKQKI
eukprot:TRINITY_DN2087_c0_g1_i11.p3 TRINITY_DN2087_c0_g1~~TRINITY_DN2087_c0_g1_i11.p3  ORF type:complete len:193 (+),score=-15.52 TRINITY_DN2087_c0_g1_i11:2844-3422(+)